MIFFQVIVSNQNILFCEKPTLIHQKTNLYGAENEQIGPFELILFIHAMKFFLKRYIGVFLATDFENEVGLMRKTTAEEKLGIL